LSWVLAGSFFGGLIAGEGSYIESRCGDAFSSDGSPRKRFGFSITMAEWDAELIVALQRFLDVGRVRRRAPARVGWQPTVTLRVQSHLANRLVIIPFSERFLPPSHKREQFEMWRAAFFAYESDHPTRWGRGPSTCSAPGCDRPVRGRGLCRSHYYRATGY